MIRFLISLLSSLFLHSSKPPGVTGFLWGGGGVGSGVKVVGRTGQKQNEVNYVEMKKSRCERFSLCVRSCLRDTVPLSSFSCLLRRMHSCSLASSSSCTCLERVEQSYVSDL